VQGKGGPEPERKDLRNPFSVMARTFKLWEGIVVRAQPETEPAKSSVFIEKAN